MDCNNFPICQWIQAGIPVLCEVSAYQHLTPRFLPCIPPLRIHRLSLLVCQKILPSPVSKVLPWSDTQQAKRKAVLLPLSPSHFSLSHVKC